VYDVYDVFILGLMIVGITSLVVFSYKIFHSRVYPVGIVRRVPAAQEDVEDASDVLPDFNTDLQAEFMSLLNKGLTKSEIAQYLRVSEHDIKDHLRRMTWKMYAKRSQSQHKFVLHNLHLRETAFVEPVLEEKVVEHGEATKLHSRLEDIEKRIRRLEVESVQKLQEAEEKPQSPQVVH